MAAMKQRVKHVKGSEYFPYPLYMLNETDWKLKKNHEAVFHWFWGFIFQRLLLRLINVTP